jgi:hypothetical protein
MDAGHPLISAAKMPRLASFRGAEIGMRWVQGTHAAF